jgi:hypothetical protein
MAPPGVSLLTTNVQLLNAGVPPCDAHRFHRTTAITGSVVKGQQSSAEGESSTHSLVLGSVGVLVCTQLGAQPSSAWHFTRSTARQLNFGEGVCYCCRSLHPDTTRPSPPTTQWSMPYDALALLRLLECCSLEQPPTTQLFAATTVGKHSIAGATQGVHNLVDVESAKDTIHRQVHAAINLIVAAGANRPQA